MPIIGSASVQIRAIDKFFERDVRAAVRKIKNVDIELKADVDLTKVNKKLRDLRYRMRNNVIQLNIDAQTETIEQDFERIVDKFHNRRVTIQGNADTGMAEAQLAMASRNRSSTINAKISPETQKALKGLFYTITGSIPFDKVKAGLLGLAGNFEAITIKGAAVVSVVSALASELFAATGAASALATDLLDIVGLSAALPAGIFMFGTAITAATIGFKGFFTALTNTGKKGAEAFASLSDGGKEAVESLRGLGKEISTPVKDAFWDALDKSLQNMVKTSVPALKAGLTNTAKAMGGLFKDGFNSMEKFVKSGGLKTMFDGSNQGLQNMRKGIDPLVTALGKLGVVGSKFLPEFGDWMGKLGVKFGNFIDQAGEDKISGWIRDAVTSIQLLGSSIGSVAGIFKGINDAANIAGFGGLRAFSDSLAGAAEVANSEPFKSQLVTFFKGAQDASKTLHTAVGNLFKTLGSASQVFAGFFREGSGAIAALIDNISAMFSSSDMLAGLYTGLRGFNDAMTAMKPGFVSLGGVIGNIGVIASGVFTSMAPGFNDIMSTLDQIFAALAPGLEAVIPIFNAFVQSIVSLASGPIVTIAQGLGNLLTAFSQMPGFLQIILMSMGTLMLLGPKLKGVFGSISDGFGRMRGRMDGDFTGLSTGAQRTMRQFTAMKDHIGRAGAAMRMIPFAAATSGLGGVATAARAAAGQGAKAGLRGLSGAASGLMGLMGGPWGLAIGGATALLGMYGAAQEESKQKVEALSQTLDQQTGAISSATKGMLATNALDGATNDWDNFFRGMMQNSKSTEETLDQLGISTKDYTDKLADPAGRDAYVKGFERIRDALRNGIPVTDEMAAAIGTTKEALEGMNDDSMAHLGEKAKNAADELTKAETKTRALAEATGITSAQAKILEGNFTTLASASSSAGDKFSALKSNLDILSGGMQTTANAKKTLGQALDDTKASLIGIADGGKVSLNALFSIKDGFDFASQSGRDFHTAMEGAADGVLKSGTAALDQALKAGKSVADAQSIAMQAMQPGVAALRKQLADLGVESPKIDAIIRSFGLMPDQIATAINVNGAEEAQRKIILTKLAADSFSNGNYRAVLGALPEGAKAAIAAATGSGKAFAEGDYDAVLEAIDKTGIPREQALAQILAVTNGDYTAALKAMNLTPPEVEAAKKKIDQVVGKKVTLEAVDGVSGPAGVMRRAIDAIQGKMITITTNYTSTGNPGTAGRGTEYAVANGGIFNGGKPVAGSLGTNGNFGIKAFAGGGIEKHVAQFAKAGAMRLWAEPETGGEAYIPLAKAKRGRSLKILEEVARIFGFGLHSMQMANGGTTDQPLAPRPTVSSGGPDVSFNVFPSPGLSEQQIGKAAMDELYWKLKNK